MASTPLLSRTDLGMRPRKAVPGAINSEGQTAHYGGPSPWGTGPDRTSAATFRDTTDHARCASIWRAWQAYHMDAKGWNDIAYNSGICPHGYRLEGRGPGVRSGANGTNDGNARSTATCYIAGDADPITDEAKVAYLDECERMTRARWQHGDWKATACAGAPIRDWKMQGWARPASSAPAPTPQPTPTPQPSPTPLEYAMDTLDLRNAQNVLVTGKHVDNLQGLLIATWAVIPAIHEWIPKMVNGYGLPDGKAGNGTKQALIVFQKHVGLNAVGYCGDATWKRLIEF